MKNGRPLYDYEPVRRGGRKSLAPREALLAEGWPTREEDVPEEKRAREAQGEQAQAEPSSSALLAERFEQQQFSVLKRGHLLSFIGLLMFTVAMYLRAYILPTVDFIPFILATLTLICFFPAQLSVEGGLTGGVREVHLALLLCLAGLLSVPLAYDKAVAFENFWALTKTVLMFVVLVGAVRTEWRLKVMLYLMLGISTVLSIAALRDYQSGALTIEGYRVKGAITGGVFEDPNDMAAFLVAMLPIAIALGLAARGLWRKVLLLLYAVVSLGAVIVTFSRGGFLALIAMGLVLVWKLGRRHRFVSMFTAVFIGAAFITLSPGHYWLRMASIFVPSLDPLGSASSRSALLKQSILVALRHPISGIGMGNFMLISINEHVTHNAYTQVASEMGLPALVIYLLFTLTPIRRLRRIEEAEFQRGGRRRSRFYYLSVGMQASLIGYAVSSFFISVAFYPVIYYLVGYAVALRRLYESARAREEKTAAAAPAASADELLDQELPGSRGPQQVVPSSY